MIYHLINFVYYFNYQAGSHWRHPLYSYGVEGMLVLTLTAAITKLHPHKCVDTLCEGPTPWQMTFLLSGFVFLIIGASGIRPCNLAFGADQFNPNTESGQRGIASFFNWYYFTFTFAMMVSLTVIVYVQANINWAIGLGIPTFLMFLSCAVFFIGTRIYVRVPPEGSPLTSIFQVLVATIKKRKLDLEEPSVSLLDHVSTKSINLKLPYTNQLRYIYINLFCSKKKKKKTCISTLNPKEHFLLEIYKFKTFIQIRLSHLPATSPTFLFSFSGFHFTTNLVFLNMYYLIYFFF
ncbi:putative proton-dependent oligopeptide transporter family, MFS transporter superfamily [Helianthus anomalus]